MVARPKQKTLRSKKHLSFVAELPCLICKTLTDEPAFTMPSAGEAHHLLKATEKGIGRKNGDDWAVPLCNIHHTGRDGVHRAGDEIKWFRSYGIDYDTVKAQAQLYWKISPK